MIANTNVRSTIRRCPTLVAFEKPKFSNEDMHEHPAHRAHSNILKAKQDASPPMTNFTRVYFNEIIVLNEDS